MIMGRVNLMKNRGFTGPLVEATSPTLEDAWKRRAERLAQVPEEEETGKQIQLLVFRLGREHYGIDAQYIFDIRQLGDISQVPRTPRWIVGVIYVRGQILSVIDLRQFLKLPEAQPQAEKEEGAVSQPKAYQVLVETSAMEVALLVDEVISVEALPLSRIEKYTETLGELLPEYVSGIFPNAFGSHYNLIVLDLPALLGDKRLIIDEKFI